MLSDSGGAERARLGLCSLEGPQYNATNLANHDLGHMVSPNVSACHLACCSEQACGGFTYTPYLDRAYTPSLDRASPACARGSSCCFLKTRGALKEQLQPRRAAHDERDTARPGARAAAGGSCQSPDDCFGGGDCASRRCACDATWTGPHCEQLHLLPIDVVHPGFPVDGPGPTRPSLPTNSTFPWGGAVAEDQGVFHLLFTEWLNHCPMTFKTFATSTHIAHATAPTAVGPWTRVGVAVPQAAGNPALSRAPDGTWLLYFTNYRWDSPVRNCTGPASATSWGPPAYQPTGRPYPGGKACGGPHGETMGLSLAYSKNLSGPWTIKYDVISVPATNPGGPVFLGNGTLLLPFQTWLPTHECTKPTCITIVSAPSWDAFPYRTCPLGTPGLDRSTCIEQYDGPLSVEAKIRAMFECFARQARESPRVDAPGTYGWARVERRQRLHLALQLQHHELQLRSGAQRRDTDRLRQHARQQPRRAARAAQPQNGVAHCDLDSLLPEQRSCPARPGW